MQLHDTDEHLPLQFVNSFIVFENLYFNDYSCLSTQMLHLAFMYYFLFEHDFLLLLLIFSNRAINFPGV